MDEIRIKGLEVFAHHGVFKEETTLGQKFCVNATLFLSTREAGLDDELEKSINYGIVCKEITDFLTTNTFQLLEAAVEHLAASLLMKYRMIKQLDIEIEKPWAPVGLPIQTVSVKISRKWHKAYLSFGSNMGERASYIRGGIEALGHAGGCQVTKVSDLFVTKAYGLTSQDDFLNGCLELDTLLSPEELLMVLHQIEAESGRERFVHWGPRTLDLDIIFYDREVYDSDDLMIPHVDMANREFVLQPLSQLIPNYRHPILNKTVLELYQQLQTK